MSDTLHVPRIKTLPAVVANQIAAGEVVERPASVVKECLENALDAGAQHIKIHLENAGKNLIQIADDGHGIHPDDLALVVKSHATSKIHQSDDLTAIQSFGFRGEALASIASVSRFTVTSALADAQNAMQLHCHQNTCEQLPAARNRGTTIEVRDLFYNTPARKKFLRANNTEYHHIVNVIKGMALSHFNCRFEVFHNGKRVFDYRRADEDFGLRVSDVVGKGFCQQSLAFEYQHNNMRLWGWLGRPEAARNQSDKQFLFINNRLVHDKQIQHAIRLAYQDHLYPGRFPSYVIFLELDISRVDVNVHPSKQEVRLDDVRTVHDYVYLCLSQLLNDKQIHNDEIDLTVKHVEETAAQYNKPNLLEPKQTEHAVPGVLWQQRYVLRETQQGWLLIDTVPALEFMLRQQLQQNHTPALGSRALLFPYKYGSSEKNIQQLLSFQSSLMLLGMEIESPADQLLLIHSLPEFISSIHLQEFLADLLECDGDVKECEQLFDRLWAHSDISLPQDKQHPLLIALCEFAMNYQDLDQARTLPWRMLTEHDLQQLLG